MSKKLTKVLSVILAAAFILTLAACSTNNGKDTTAATTAAATTAAATTAAATTAAATTAAATTAAATTAAATTAAATTAPATADRVKIRWVGAEYGPVDENAPVKKIVEDRFGVELELIYVEATTYAEQMGLKFASKDIPDMFHARSPVIYREWVSQEVLCPLDLDTIKELAPGMYAEVDHWTQQVKVDLWESVRVDGVIYGMPQLNTDGMFAAPVIYRDDWMKNVGIEKEPETLEEWTDMLYKFAKNDPDGNGKADTYGLSQSGLNAFWGVYGYLPTIWSYLPDGTVGYGGVQPEIKDALAMFATWYKDGVLDPEYITGENTGGYWALSHSFINSRIGMSCHGSYYHWNPPYYEGHAGGSNYKPFMEVNPEGSYALAKHNPVMPDGSGVMSSGLGTTGSQGVMGYQVEDHPEVMEKILAIIDANYTDYDFYLMVKNGIEGEHWEFDENGVVVQTKEWQEKIKTYDSGLVASASIGCSNCFCPVQSMIHYQKLQKYQYDFANSTVAHYQTTINVKQLIMPSESEYITDLDTLRSTTFTDIITGAQPVDAFDQFVEDWLAQGGKQITDEVNEVYKK